MADELRATYNHKNPLLRWFFRKKIEIAIRLARLKRVDVILDFGCGAGWLKNKLKRQGYNVFGYDVTPEHSDVEDYMKVRADKIFALDVFEHIEKEEIREIIKNFKEMNSNFELVVAIPTENWISRKVRRLLGKRERVVGHITSLKEILGILKSELELIHRVNFLSVSWIGVFRNI